MQTNNNHKSDLTCRFGETLVAVLYGEADAQETEKLYSHLETCTACSEELTAFGSLRNSISDWRETEFAPLATPEIVLPQEKQIAVLVETGKTSWLDALRGFFTPANLGWQAAGVSFAGLLILGFLVLFFGSLTYKPEIEVVSSQPKPSVTATPEIKNSPKPVPTDKTVNGNTRPESVVTPKDEKQEVAPIRANVKTPKQPVVRTTNNNLPKRPVQVRRQQQNYDDISILPTEAEDKSPRLTDLLDEVEPST